MRKTTLDPETVKAKLRNIAEMGIVNYMQSDDIIAGILLIEEMEELIETLEERVAIMSEDQYKCSEIRFP